MQLLTLLGWLYWNPPQEAFRVPWIDRPVVWYGILFVTGFVIGYFLFVSILTTHFKNANRLFKLDILNWSKLLSSLQKQSLLPGSIFAMPKELSFLIKEKEIKENKLNPEKKEALLQFLNGLILSQSISRNKLTQILEGIAPIRQTAYFLADKLLWFIVIGTLIGARLGHILFYDWQLFWQHPIEIVKVWKGGLASHGGVCGVFIALYLFYLSIQEDLPSLSFLRLLDFVAIPSALAACLIRLGNFMNQEIVGTATNLPWAVVFGRAADGSLPIPRHPVQLYEAFAYLLTFIFLFSIWKRKKERCGEGFYIGLLFTLVFSARFILEFWKVDQSSLFQTAHLQIGQLLSLPFVLLGILWLIFSKENFSKNIFKKNS